MEDDLFLIDRLEQTIWTWAVEEIEPTDGVYDLPVAHVIEDLISLAVSLACRLPPDQRDMLIRHASVSLSHYVSSALSPTYPVKIDVGSLN